MEVIKPWKNVDTKRPTVYILFKEKNYERTGNMIKKIWEHR